MTTYKTYQEAKIANPESDIYYTMISNGGRDAVFGLVDELNKFTAIGHICNPADYCMTVEKFLTDGYEFVEGDCYIDFFGDVQAVGEDVTDGAANKPDVRDNRRYVLRAKALEQPKHTKVEYVKVDVNSEGGKFYEVARDFAEGESCVFYYRECDGDWGDVYWEIPDNCSLLKHYNARNLYRKVTTELTEREAFIESASKIMHKINGGVINDASLGAVFNELVEGK